MNGNNSQYFILMDFLFQKYKIEYENDMSPQRVIEKVQEFLYPNEISKGSTSTTNEKKHQKLQLYRSSFPDYYGAVPVTENIKIEDINYTKFQFYLFRPMINVYLSIYVVDQANIDINKYILKLDIIFPIKKKVMSLKNYLQETLIQYAIDTENDYLETHMRKKFSLQKVTDLIELINDEYIEPYLNDSELYLILGNNNDNLYLQPICRFYYSIQNSLEIPSSPFLDSEGDADSLDYDEEFTLRYAQRKLLEKHFDARNIPNGPIISFNGRIQTNEFNRLDDLFSDNDYYRFKVFFNTQNEDQNLPTSNGDAFDIPIPNKGRPLIIKIKAGKEK